VQDAKLKARIRDAMLARLYVKNFALIREVEIEFGPCLNVITGETGAGKSILLGALEAILGGKTRADLVRQGTDKCIVEGLFEFAPEDPTVARLEALEAAPEEGQLALRREIYANGRSRALVNGLVLPLKRLKAIGTVLVDLHGQHEHQSLLDARLHLGFLDAYGGLNKQVDKVGQLYRAYKSAEGQTTTLLVERHALKNEEELRLFQLNEIRQLNPDPTEEEHLEREVRRLTNCDTLGQTTIELHDSLYQSEGSLYEQLGQARRRLERLIETDASLAAQAQALEGLIYNVEDLANGLRDYARTLEPDPERLEQLHERLEALRRLKLKYGGTLEQVLEAKCQLEAEENRSDTLDEDIRQAQAQRQQSLQAFSQFCLTLAQARQKAAAALASQIERSLKALGMANAAFSVERQLTEASDGLVEDNGRRWRAGEHGLDTVEFYISANAGEPLRPLTRVASGGEISRIMLALKEAIAEKDTVSTLVFDEIDTGISGRIAATVGKKLDALSNSHQTTAITHLPQIASLAHHHFSVRKRQEKGRTLTEVHSLDADARTEEIASLLAGETVSDTARQHAQQMLR